MVKIAHDRLVAGTIAGVIGAIFQNVYGVIVKALGITEVAFIDFAGVLAILAPTKSFFAYIVNSIFHLVFCALLGIVFAYLIKITSSRYYWIKTLGYGAALWFLILSAGTIFKLPLFAKASLSSAITTLLGSLLYAVIVGWVLQYLERKTGLI